MLWWGGLELKGKISIEQQPQRRGFFAGRGQGRGREGRRLLALLLKKKKR